MENTIGLLVKKYLETGNEHYFEELVIRFQPLIKSYARKLYYLEYEDSMQELTLALYEAVIRITKTEDEYGCISYIKKSVMHRFCKLYYESIEVQKIQESSISPDFSNILTSRPDSEIYDCIYKIDLENFLRGKNKLERTIISLILSGYSDGEIGQKLGYSRQYINRIKKKILDK